MESHEQRIAEDFRFRAPLSGIFVMSRSLTLTITGLRAFREHRDLNLVDRKEPVIPACF
jgi:hypothetical protein